MKSDNCCWNPAVVAGFRQTDQNPANWLDFNRSLARFRTKRPDSGDGDRMLLDYDTGKIPTVNIIARFWQSDTKIRTFNGRLELSTNSNIK
jgi:hypothetical protein